MKSEIILDFGKTIRALRTEKKISQEELAELCGFHRTYIGQIERGERNPSLKNIEVFAKSFGISISDLFIKCQELKKLSQLG